MHTAAKTRAAEARIAMVVRAHMRREGIGRLEGPLVAHVTGVWKRLVKHSRVKHEGRLYKATAADADNLAKLVFDAMNGIAYRDDALIVKMTAETMFCAVDEEPCIEIRLWRAPEFPP